MKSIWTKIKDWWDRDSELPDWVLPRVGPIVIVAIFILIFYRPFSPEMPIEFMYRQSLIGAGYVAVLKNKSDRELTVEIKFVRKEGFQEKTLRDGNLTIPANGERQVGWLEGVSLSQGDVIRVRHPDFRPFAGSIPKSFN